MWRRKPPNEPEPPTKTKAESNASDRPKSYPSRASSDGPGPTTSDAGLEAAASNPAAADPDQGVDSIRSEASRVGPEGGNASNGSHGVIIVDNEKPESTHRASVGVEAPPRRAPMVASSTSNDGSTASSAASERFKPSWVRFIPLIGYHHVLMMMLGIVVILLPLVLAGCTSTGSMQGLRLVSISQVSEAPSPQPGMLNATMGGLMMDLSMNETQGKPMVREVHVGYFAICARLDSDGWQCGIHGATVTGKANADDPLGLVDMGYRFRTETVSPVLLIITILLCAIVILALSTFPGWHGEEDSLGSMREVRPFPSRPLRILVLLCSSLVTAVLYVAVMWQHVSCAATGRLVESLRYDAVEVHTGTAAAVLGWMSVFLCAICAVGVIVMNLSLGVLESLINEI